MANELRTAALADSPIVLYDFISGSEDADSGAGGYDLTVTSVTQGTASYFDGEVGSGLFDDAVPSQASVTNAALDDLLQADSDVITIEALVRANGFPSDKYIVSKGTPGGGNFWGLYFDVSNSNRPTFICERATTNEINTVSNGSYVTGAWYFIQCVVSGSNATQATRWRLNGDFEKIINSNASAGAGSYTSDSGTSFKVGYTGTAGDEFSGDIAFLAIYDGDIGDSALSAHYIALLNGDSTYNNHILTHTSVKAFYSFDERAAATPPTTTSNSVGFHDLSGNANYAVNWNGCHGSGDSLVADATGTDGHSSATFGGTRFNTNSTSVWATGTSYTVEVWARPTSLVAGATRRALISSWYSGAENYIIQQGNVSESNVWVTTWKDSGGGNQSIQTVTSAATDTTVHLVMVYDSTAGRTLYYNGVAAGSTTDTYHKSTTDRRVCISGYLASFSTSSSFYGRVHKAVLYDEALSAEEVLAHYNMGITGEAPSGGGGGGGGGGKAVKARRRGGGNGGGANGSKGGGGRSASRAIARWDRRRRRLS